MTQIVQYWDWPGLLKKQYTGQAVASLFQGQWWVDYFYNDKNAKTAFIEIGVNSLPYPVHNVDPDNGLFLGTNLVSSSPVNGITVPLSGKHKVITPNFKERCAAGEIIINPYEVWSGSIRANPVKGPSEKKVIDSTIAWAGSPSLWSSLPSSDIADWRYPKQVARYYSLTPDSQWTRIDYGQIPSVNLIEESQEVYPPEHFQVDTFTLTNLAEHILDIARNIPENGSLVQETMAKANSGTLDALTAVAELPDLIQSLIDGFKLLAKITRDARKKEFKLFQQRDTRTALKEAQLQAEFDRDTSLRTKTFEEWRRDRGNKGSPKAYHNYVRKMDTRRKNKTAQLNKRKKRYRLRAEIETANAVAAVYLNFRYNISTTVYMLEDIGETFLRMSQDIFMRWREKEVTPFDFGEYQFTGSATVTSRAFIKRQLEVASGLKKLGQLLMVDVLVTGFELIPLWSIISDWFFTIGSFLRAFRWNYPESQEGASFSWKTEIDGTVLIPLSGGQELEVELKLQHYRRIVIRPEAYYGIYWKPDVSFWRQLDAIAFLWNEVSSPASKKVYSYR